MVWLLTGQGEPFLLDSTIPTHTNEVNAPYSKKFFGNSAAFNSGPTTQHSQTNTSSSDPDASLAAMQALVEQLRSQLADKERTIQILLTHQQK